MVSLRVTRDSDCAAGDENDWPVLATAIALACPVWTEDEDFFGTGVAVWTTNRIEIFLKERAKSSEPLEE